MEDNDTNCSKDYSSAIPVDTVDLKTHKTSKKSCETSLAPDDCRNSLENIDSELLHQSKFCEDEQEYKDSSVCTSLTKSDLADIKSEREAASESVADGGSALDIVKNDHCCSAESLESCLKSDSCHKFSELESNGAAEESFVRGVDSTEDELLSCACCGASGMHILKVLVFCMSFIVAYKVCMVYYTSAFSLHIKQWQRLAHLAPCSF